MRHLKSLKIIVLLLFAGWIAMLSLPTCVKAFSGAELDANRVPWTRLSFNAQNFWIDVSTDIQLISLPSDRVETALISTPKGIPIKPAASESSQMTINTTIDPRFRSPVRIHNRIWFNTSDATALGRIRLRRGDDDFKKIYRFTNQGVFRHRVEPKNKQEVSQAPEKWTDIMDSFYPYNQTLLGCSGVSERSLPIYIISASAGLKQTDSMTLCVFGKRQLHRLTLRKAGVYPINVSFIEKKQQTETRREGIVKALKITLASEPMESDLNEDENFSFMGFQKDISIYIDPSNGLPIQASGSIATAGKARLKLNSVWLKN